MRSTVRLDDDLMLDLKAEAQAEGVSLSRMLNRTLRIGLRAQRKRPKSRKQFEQNTFRMGSPFVSLDKALALAGNLEDQEVIRKMSLRK